jgi:hypothetical protein
MLVTGKHMVLNFIVDFELTTMLQVLQAGSDGQGFLSWTL